MDGLLTSLKSQLQRGAQLRAPGGFGSHAEAVGSLGALRNLISDLEAKIAAQCDPKRWPQGNTQRAEFALQLFASLRVNEDSVDMLMCAPRVTRSR